MNTPLLLSLLRLIGAQICVHACMTGIRMAAPLMELRSLGWGPTLDRIGRRLAEAFTGSNLPPTTGPIPAKALRLAEAVRLAEATEKAKA